MKKRKEKPVLRAPGMEKINKSVECSSFNAEDDAGVFRVIARLSTLRIKRYKSSHWGGTLSKGTTLYIIYHEIVHSTF